MCDHLFETTSRYDNEQQLLTFLLFCPTCRIEQIVEVVPYVPAPRGMAR